MYAQMIKLLDALVITTSLLLLIQSLTVDTQQDSWAHHNPTTGSSWLKNHTTNWRRPKPPGCWSMPWVCKQRAPPMAKMRCCKNLCVDVSSDVDHCGQCGKRCPFTWQCCFGWCVNTNISPFNCGRCGNKCPFGAPCLYGMCGYAKPFPPWPFPPRRWPKRPMPPPGERGGAVD